MGFDLCGRKVHVLRDTGGGVTSAGRYRDVFAVGEFRALFGAGLLSLFGDQLARVAVTVLVFSRTGSTLLAAATFGLSYVTWVIAGPLLSVVADRLPRRTVMVACDVARIGLLGLLALPGLPILVMIGLLVVAALLEPPFRAARSAMLAEILHGELLVVGNGLVHLWTQLAQVVGFAAGGAIVAMLSARGAILVDAATFAASAALIRVFVGHRAVAGVRPDQGWLAMVGDGFRLVFADRVLRSYLVLAWVGSSATAAPEGLMVSLAGQLHGGSRATGILLAAMPLGTVIGVVLYARVTSPARRRRLVRPMALLSCLALVPLWGGRSLTAVLVLLVLAGYGAAYVAVLNALYVQKVPAAHRARAFGVAASGMMLGQGLATLAAGALAEVLNDPAVVMSLCGLAGAVAMLPVLVRWPDAAQNMTRGLVPDREGRSNDSMKARGIVEPHRLPATANAVANTAFKAPQPGAAD